VQSYEKSREEQNKFIYFLFRDGGFVQHFVPSGQRTSCSKEQKVTNKRAKNKRKARFSFYFRALTEKAEGKPSLT
jgi:hypothetical protein